MFRTTNVQNKWKIGSSEGILFHFPPKTPLSAGNAPALTSPAKRSVAPSPACTCSVRLPQRPIRLPHRPVRLPHRTVRFLHDPAPPGSFIVPPHPHAGTTATPLSRCPHHPLLFSRRSGNHSFRPAESPRRLEQKNRLFFGVFVKFLLLLQHIAVTTLYPRRNGLHAASASLLTREFR